MTTLVSESAMREFDELIHDDFVRMDAQANGGRDGLRMIFDAETERAITEPHSREKIGAATVWLIWLWDQDGDYTHIPQLHAICTNEYSVRYHLGALQSQREHNPPPRPPVFRTGISDERQAEDAHNWASGVLDGKRWTVERAGTDHAYGSTMLQAAQEKMFFSPPISVVAQARSFEFGGDE